MVRPGSERDVCAPTTTVVLAFVWAERDAGFSNQVEWACRQWNYGGGTEVISKPAMGLLCRVHNGHHNCRGG
jgi:hypothetical protein